LRTGPGSRPVVQPIKTIGLCQKRLWIHGIRLIQIVWVDTVFNCESAKPSKSAMREQKYPQ
jgi:hypothetical protein